MDPQHWYNPIYFVQEEDRRAGEPEAQERQPVPAGAGQARQAHQGQGYPGTVPATLQWCSLVRYIHKDSESYPA